MEIELIEAVRALYNQIKVARTLVDDGKEVQCSRQLQGAQHRCYIILDHLIKRHADEILASKNTAEAPGEESQG